MTRPRPHGTHGPPDEMDVLNARACLDDHRNIQKPFWYVGMLRSIMFCQLQLTYRGSELPQLATRR